MKQDLRRWIREAEASDELVVLKDVDWNVEMGAVADLAIRQPNVPALLFDDVPGYPAGYRVLVNSLAEPGRAARTAGLPRGLTPLEAVRAWKDSYREIAPVPFRLVRSGPVMENPCRGAEVLFHSCCIDR